MRSGAQRRGVYPLPLKSVMLLTMQCRLWYNTVNIMQLIDILWIVNRLLCAGGATVDAHQIVARLIAALIIWAADVYIYHRRR